MIPIAILCGGKGTRIAAIANGLPKALVPVAGEPFLAHQLRWLRAEGAAEVVLLTGYGAQAVETYCGDGRSFGLAIRYSRDGDEPLGTAGAVKRALPLLGDRFLTVYGDALLSAPLAEVADALASPYEGVMTVYRNDGRGLRSNVDVAGDRVTAYDKAAPPGTLSYIDYGVNGFLTEVFRSVPADRATDLAEVHRTMIARGTLRAFPVSERWYEIGSPEGLAETEAYIRNRRRGETPVR